MQDKTFAPHIRLEYNRDGCVVDGCERQAYAKGLCHSHYERKRRTGDVQADKPLRAWSTKAREARRRWRVRLRLNGCWEWQGTKLPTGYGIVLWDERMETAQRAAYLRWKGSIPVGYDVHHTCQTALCINPQHLEAVSSLEHRFMPKRNSLRVSPEALQETVELYRSGLTLVEVGQRLGIHHNTVWKRLRAAEEPRRKGGRRAAA